jgi:Type I restriction modification DNA specificity domain
MKLRELAEIRMGYTFRSSLKECTQGNTAVLQMRDASEEGVAQPTQFARVDIADLPAHYLLVPGDLIFRSRGLVNTTALITQPWEPTICIAPLMFIRITRADLVLPAYMQWFINLASTQKQIDTYARGSTVRMIPAESMKGLEIVLPGLEVQQKIVDTVVLNQEIQAVSSELASKTKQHLEHTLLQYAKGSLLQAAA